MGNSIIWVASRFIGIFLFLPFSHHQSKMGALMAHNKNIIVGILLAEIALLKSPYVKCYMQNFGN
ncbi:hypothetical protein GLIP_3581 [Aliiglaciecola lipolytica E3]|uniref:Uncharacterized protein n=1 Tax=Aliiglaciecola lipolytica E3 TaxID=1127673 RepID=K6YDB4_9ALTE|nr:hypothetical protein GLIP_3581 [Aliiglaciecola lipolytica E3]